VSVDFNAITSIMIPPLKETFKVGVSGTHPGRFVFNPLTRSENFLREHG